MEEIVVKARNEFIKNSFVVPVEPSEVYEVKIPLEYVMGGRESVIFIVQFLDDMKKPVDRRYKFLKNLEDKIQTITLRCAVPIGARFAIYGIRINCEGAISSDVKIKIPKIDEWDFQTTKNNLEDYDDDYDYVKKYEETDLDKEPWEAVGMHVKNKSVLVNRANLLKKLGLEKNSTVLDVGCGTGFLVEVLKSYLDSPKNYVGTDLVQKAVDFCRAKFPEFEFYKNESDKIPDLGRKFDMITLFSVFTHLYPNEIRKLLVELKKFLKDNGVIIATVNINDYVTTEYIGTKTRIEMTEKSFFKIVKSSGFTKMSRYPGREKGRQTIYMIQL